ncbi:LysR family transcriptional regulator [Neisseriaceae bacterium TC5R-5]|nr:LysR family transcriptional regulator [Neisseriaceae bacterium TC5R-5]
MNLRQIEFALALAEEESFTRAAARCHTVQSALSHQIAKLEESFGARLFERNSRSVVLTTAGQTFLIYARQLQVAAQRLQDEMAAATGEIRGSLKIGSIATLYAIDLPYYVARYYQQHPQVDMSITHQGSELLLAQLPTHEIDIAFVGLWAGERLEQDHSTKCFNIHVLAEEALVAIVSPHHPLAHESELTLQALSDENMVDYPRQSKARIQTDQAFEAQGLKRRVSFEVQHIQWQEHLVRQGIAVALVPQSASAHLQQVVAIPVLNAPRRRVYCLSNIHPTPAAQAFMSLIQSQEAALPQHVFAGKSE